MSEGISKAKEYLTSKLDLPKEIVMNLPRIIVVGQEEITIENHKGIIAFSTDSIKINSGIGTLKIDGKNFEILFIGGDTLTIGGRFKSIIYEGQV